MSTPVTLFHLELAVKSADYPEAERLLSLMLKSINDNRLFIKTYETKQGPKRVGVPPFDLDNNDVLSAQHLERFTNIISYLFADPNYEPREGALYNYLILKGTFTNLFAASSYGNMDHILHELKIIQPNSKEQLTPTPFQIRRMLMCFTLYSNFQFPWNAFINTSYSELVVTSMVGLTAGAHVCLTAQAKEHKDRALLGLTDYANTAVNNSNLVSAISSPWFLCSYSSHEKRHEFKAAANQLISQYVNNLLSDSLKKKIANNLNRTLKSNKKPLLAVLVEKYGSSHAMYRCYHPLIKNLREQFEVIAFAATGDLDGISKEDFDKVVEIEPLKPIAEHIAKVIQCKPDMVLYPSLGMNNWTLQTASVRLAKVQVMLPGHPASSFMENIDYIVPVGLEPVTDELQGFCSEKVIDLSAEAPTLLGGFAPHQNLPSELPCKAIGDDVVRIAVNGVIHKVTPEFIQMCQKLTASTDKKLEFVFFMSVNNRVTLFAAKALLSRLVPNSVVYSYQSYPEYLQKLANCDLAVPTFPFGGTNSNLDAILLGMPKLILKGSNDLASYTDHMFWELFANIDQRLFAESEDDLTAKALALIEDETLRQKLSGAIRNIDVSGNAFNAEQQLLAAKNFTNGLVELVGIEQ